MSDGETINRIPVRLPHSLYVALCEYAREHEMSLNQVVRGAIREKVGR